MFTMQLIYLDSFMSEFQEKNYEIFTFCDPQTLTLIRGTNLTADTLEIGKLYKCTISYKRNKLVVSDIVKAV